MGHVDAADGSHGWKRSLSDGPSGVTFSVRKQPSEFRPRTGSIRLSDIIGARWQRSNHRTLSFILVPLQEMVTIPLLKSIILPSMASANDLILFSFNLYLGCKHSETDHNRPKCLKTVARQFDDCIYVLHNKI